MPNDKTRRLAHDQTPLRYSLLVMGILMALPLLGASPPMAVAQSDPPTEPLFTNCGGSTPTTPEPEWVDDLSPVRYENETVEDQTVPLADGTLLAVRVHRPVGPTEPIPSLVILNPYNGIEYPIAYWPLFDGISCAHPTMVPRGYNLVTVDPRGVRNSGGCADATEDAPVTDDAYAVIEWVAAQEWSTDRVGVYGSSARGYHATAALVAAPPSLKAAVLTHPPVNPYDLFFSQGAKLRDAPTADVTDPAVESAAPPDPRSGPVTPYAERFCGTPRQQSTEFDGDFSAAWQARDLSRSGERAKAAVLLTHGFDDGNVAFIHSDRLWKALEGSGADRRALFGPWTHVDPPIDHWWLHFVRFYDHWLKDIDTGLLDEPAVTYGRDDGSFGQAQDWPPASTKAATLHLSDGRLVPSKKVPDGTASYTDTPWVEHALMRSIGGHLTYTSPPLASAAYMTGTPQVSIVAEVDAHDANFAAYLYKVSADGSRKVLTFGYMDARHHADLAAGSDLEPGVLYRFTWDLRPASKVVEAGQALELYVASTDFCEQSLSRTREHKECASTGIYSDTTTPTVTLHEGRDLSYVEVPWEREKQAHP